MNQLSLVSTQLCDTDARTHLLREFVRKNLLNEFIDKIIILVENASSEFIRDLQSLSERLVLIPTQHRPSFKELTSDSIYSFIDSEYAVIINSDIQLIAAPENWKELDEALCSSVNTVLTLTRRDDNNHDKLLSVNGYLPEYLSSDGWIFKRPFPFINLDTSLGQINLEVAINSYLYHQGFVLANACDLIKAIHLDKTLNNYHASSMTAIIRNLEAFDVSVKPLYKCILPFTTPDSFIRLLYSEQLLVEHSQLASKIIAVDANYLLNQDNPSIVVAFLATIAQEYDRIIAILFEDILDSNLYSQLSYFQSRSGKILFLRGYQLHQVTQSLIEQHDLIIVSSLATLSKELCLQRLPLIIQANSTNTPFHCSHFTQTYIYHWLRYGLHLINSDDLPNIDSLSNLIFKADLQLLTCTYGADKYIETFLDNIKQQSDVYPAQIVHSFADSNPSTYSLSLIFNYLESRNGFILLVQDDPGLYPLWNRLISYSNEPFISNANPDDLRAPSHSHELIKLLQIHKDCLIASSAVFPIFGEEERKASIYLYDKVSNVSWFSKVPEIYDINYLFSEANAKNFPLEPHNIPHCAPIWKRQIHEEYGYFDEDTYGSEADWALWASYGANGGLFAHCSKPLSGYYVSETSYGRVNSLPKGRYKIVINYLAGQDNLDNIGKFSAKLALKRKHCSKSPLLISSKEAKNELAVNIYGLDAYYGEHRHANNLILSALSDLHSEDSSLVFHWFLERYFIWGISAGERGSSSFKPISQPWIGCLHVPPLTPHWANNQFANLYFQDEWQESLKQCKGLIALSDCMAKDLKLLYPAIPVYSIKHPFPSDVTIEFQIDEFLENPKVVLVGYWLRNHYQFYKWNSPFKKFHLIKNMSDHAMRCEFKVYGYPTEEEISSVNRIDFLPDDEYDYLLKSSLVYISTYETSANNALIECLMMRTPFIASRHPAMEEYVGKDYPLFMDSYHLPNWDTEKWLQKVQEAHHYLVKADSYRDALGLHSFKQSIKKILGQIC